MLIKGYSDLSMETPACHPGSLLWRVNFKLDADVSPLFPYINAIGEKAAYSDNPVHIQFILGGYRCALYPDHVIAGLFNAREEAVEFIGRLIAYLNDIERRKDSITPSHKRIKSVPILSIYKLHPKSNCGACGFETCMSFAAALNKRDAEICQCTGFDDNENDNREKLRAMIEL